GGGASPRSRDNSAGDRAPLDRTHSPNSLIRISAGVRRSASQPRCPSAVGLRVLSEVCAVTDFPTGDTCTLQTRNAMPGRWSGSAAPVFQFQCHEAGNRDDEKDLPEDRLQIGQTASPANTAGNNQARQ